MSNGIGFGMTTLRRLYETKLVTVYGGQWGSEGKGAVCAHLARKSEQFNQTLVAVRVGGPNAGHTIWDAAGVKQKLQQIPVAAFVRHGVTPVIGASGYILPDILAREIKILQGLWSAEKPRVLVDPQAVVITPEYMAAEQELRGAIGSTGEGVGAATAAKAMRRAVTFADYMQVGANGVGDLADWRTIRDGTEMVDTVRFLNSLLLVDTLEETAIGQQVAADLVGNARHQLVIMLEGTQGYQLSLNCSGYYPFVTSRDCGPDAINSQVGLTPRAFGAYRSICVLRTHPIRVGGNSGPLPNEISWDDLADKLKTDVVPERTTVTNKVRRIGEWDWATVDRTIVETRPTDIALTFADYLDPTVFGITEWHRLLKVARGGPVIPMITQITKRYADLGVNLSWVGTGPRSIADVYTSGPGYINHEQWEQGRGGPV